MVNPVFHPLFAQYPQIIREIHSPFTSHEFIAWLAQAHQQNYIAALAAYQHRQAPFRDIHSVLARHLNRYVPQLIVKDGGTIDEDIFGDRCSCMQWRKVT